jgi:hypothetical protein
MATNEDKALKSILSGKNPDRKIMSSNYNPDNDEFIKAEREKRKKEKELSEAKNEMMRKLRMPLFCPKCGLIMNKRLDTKFWNRRNKCFDCVIEEENEMRKNGTFEAYEKRVVLENKRDWLKENITQVEEYKKSTGVKFYNQINPDGHHIEEENWDVNTERLTQMADEAIEAYTTQLAEVETQLLEV